jgi:DNA polymerase-4
MWGVGPKTAPKMRALGFATLGDLARADDDALERVLGAWGKLASRLARGIDERDIVADGLARSIGAEQTYDDDLEGAEAVGGTLLEHAARTARRLVRAALGARTVTVKIKYADFQIQSRRCTLPEPVQDTDAIHGAALELLARFPLGRRRVRLTGVSVSALAPWTGGATLFPDARAEQRRAIEETTARIADRFGNERAIVRASLLGKTR